MEIEKNVTGKSHGFAGVNTGKGIITIWALLGIWSVAALTSLPGLAVSPILDKLAVIFPKATDFDLQLLTTLPSLLIIPFIFFAGFISNRIGYNKLLNIGLWLFFLSGALYFVAGTIGQLVALSALLGVGSGIIIPFSTSLVSMFFSGKERTRQYGYVSAITNITLVIATAVAGWLADVQWRLPFLVYLLPVVSIVLLPAIRRAEKSIGQETAEGVAAVQSDSGIEYASLAKYMLYYLFITYLVMVVSINLPFLLGKYGFDSGTVGMVTSLFFLAMMLPGFFINRLVDMLGRGILLWALLLIALGLIDIFYNRTLLFVIIGCVATGFGYGMAQPYVYDKTSALASPRQVTYALALLMSMNYVAIVIAPFVIELVQKMLGVKSERFPFVFNALLGLVALLVLALVMVYKKRRPLNHE